MSLSERKMLVGLYNHSAEALAGWNDFHGNTTMVQLVVIW